jgi:hypothetical protein
MCLTHFVGHLFQHRAQQPRLSHHSGSGSGPRLSQLTVVQEARDWNGGDERTSSLLGSGGPRTSSHRAGSSDALHDGVAQRTASPLQLPPHLGELRSSPLRHRRLSAPVASAFVDSDDDSELDGAAGGAEEALRQAVTLRALRRRSEARRAARVSENAADAAGLPTPSELAVRISRLDVNLQRFLVTQLVQLEASQAAAQASLAAVAPPTTRGITWASFTAEGAPAEAAGDRHEAVPRSHAHYHHHHGAHASHSRDVLPVDPDLLDEEGGPVGGAPPADGDGYASPGERDVSASDSDWRTRDESPARGVRHGQPPLARPAARKSPSPSPSRSRQPRFSLAGVAGELQLPQHGGEEEEGGAGGNQLSPRLLGPSSVRLAAKRMTHGRLPGDSVLHRNDDGRAPVRRATAF